MIKVISSVILMSMTTAAAERTVYIGTRTRDGRSEGIYRMKFNTETGALSDVKLAAASPDPSFVVVHPKRKLVFAVAATAPGKVRAFRIEADGGLTLLNEVASRGDGPAHVQIDQTGNWVSAANYTSGSIAVFRIGGDGKLSEATDSVQHEGKGANESRQAGPHAHSSYFSADNRTLYVADLGIDQVKRYAFDATAGKLKAVEPLRTPPGAGPRHIAFGKSRTYVLNEIVSSVSVFEGDRLIETVSALPEGFSGTSTAAEIVLDPAGKWLYASNRGADTIAVFRVGNHLQKVGDIKVGKTPRGYVLSPDGRYLLAASQDEDTIQSYRIDPATGLASAVGAAVKAGSPICLRFATQ